MRAAPARSASVVSDRQHVARHPHGVVILSGQEVILLGPDQPPMALAVDDPWRFDAVLRRAAQPVAVRELATSSTRRAVDVLVEAGVLSRAASAEELRTALARTPAPSPGTPPRTICRHLVIGATGAIQAFNLPRLLFSTFVPFADAVDVVLTDAARQFVAVDALAALGARTWTGPSPGEGVAVPHVHLSRADLVAITPASAACLHRVATGACSDLLSLVVAMTRAPVVLVPAMNANMWDSPAIGRNARQVVADGHYLVLPGPAIEVSGEPGAPPAYGGAGVPEHRYALVLAAILEHARSSRS
jgi:phosphopantothenoylcysteine decarboxylase / phosphopantothenate---cysteine ligase